MKAIIYVQVNEDDILDDFTLYQIYKELYKTKSTNKELAIFKLNYITDNIYAISITTRIKKEDLSDDLLTDIINIYVKDREELINEIDRYIKDNNDTYEIVLMITNLSQTSLFFPYITSVTAISSKSIYSDIM